jgi:hypothetical protein
MKKLHLAILFFGLLFASCDYAYAQCPMMPTGFVCISQEAANRAAENARTVAAQDEAIKTLKDQLVAKDGIIADNKAVAAKNQADLTAALLKTTGDLGIATGQLIEAKGNVVQLRADNALLIDKIRKRCSPFSICVN